MAKLTKKAFSLIELLVTVTILVILSSIAVSLNSSYIEKSSNSKIRTDLITIENTLRSYKQEIGNLPLPGGNLKFFTNDGLYAHDELDAFGVHGFITETTFAKRFISVTPLDPSTNQYYAYGKTINGGFFELAAVLKINDEYESIVKSNFDGENSLYNLIREYNGPGFVYDKSKSRFPYNPEERIIVARITDFTGSLTVNDSITDKNIIINKNLITGDNIKLTAGSEATIYFSDGSIGILGDSVNATDITLANLIFPKEKNLVTKIKLALNFGSVLVKASKMDSESSFEVYTSDTEASVRGTIFKITKVPNSTKSTVSVLKGTVFVNNVLNISNYNELVNKLKKDLPIDKTPILDLPTNVIEVKAIDGVQESILNEGKTIDNYLTQSSVFKPTDTSLPVSINNCYAETKNINGHNYLVPNLLDKEVKIVNLAIGINGGTQNFSQSFFCDNGTVNTSGDETNLGITCDNGYSLVGVICELNVTPKITVSGNCNNSKLPINALFYSNSRSYSIFEAPEGTSLQISYKQSPTRNTCEYTCKINTHTEDGGKTCISNTKNAVCGGTYDSNTSAPTGNSIYTQNWNGFSWQPYIYWGYNQSVCGYTCKFGFEWNGNNCIEKPVADVPTIPSQTVNPKVESYQVNGKGCGNCPGGSYMSGSNRDGLSCGLFSGERSEKYCTNTKGIDGLDVICEREHYKSTWSGGKCSGWDTFIWSGTYTPTK